MGKVYFSDVFVSLEKYWDYRRNKKVKFEEISLNYNGKIHWICGKGHSFVLSANKIVAGRWCPKCYVHFSLIEYLLYLVIKKKFPHTKMQYNIDNIYKLDIYIANKKLCIEYDGYKWHQDNEERDIRKNIYLEKMGIKVLRIREKGLPKLKNCENIFVRKSRNIEGYNQLEKHIKQITKLINKNQGLNIPITFNPYIYRQALSYKQSYIPKNSIAYNQRLMNEWSYRINKGLEPAFFSKYSHAVVFWKCREKGHFWEAPVYSRVKNGCPYCARQKVLIEMSVGFLEQWILSKWDYEYNSKNGINPFNISPKSSRRIRLKSCKFNHKPREAKLINIVKNKGSCVDCDRRKTSLGVCQPEVLISWCNVHNDISQYDCSIYDRKTVICLICSECGNCYKVIARNYSRRKSRECEKCDPRTRPK